MGRTLHLTSKVSIGIPLPDRVITRAPFLEDLIPVRFVMIIDLALALGFAVVLGQLRDRLKASRPALLGGAGPALTAGAVGVVALISPILGAQWPYPARSVVVPAVYRSPLITHLPAGTILLGYPILNGFAADPMIWQAETGFPYDTVGGYGFVPGPGPNPLGSLPPSPMTTLFDDAYTGQVGDTIPASRTEAVRRQLRSIGVSAVVVLPKGAAMGNLVRILTVVLGRPPQLVNGAAVWTDLRRPALSGS
jgi:hypothetical protein